MVERLTTLAAVKDWLDLPADSTASDAGIQRTIVAASQYIVNYLNWPKGFGVHEYTQFSRGNGKTSLPLKNWPIVAITSVDIGGATVGASTFSNGMPSTGYYVGESRAAPMTLDLYGSGFWMGAPVNIVYKAGFQTSEAFTLVSGEKVTPSSAGQWIGDLGVMDGNTPMIKIASGTPTAGHYSVDENGAYTFAVADAGKVVTITNSYCPFDVSQAATELVAEWLKRKDRIGLLSKSLGGQETITFSTQDMSGPILSILNTYRNVVPV